MISLRVFSFPLSSLCAQLEFYQEREKRYQVTANLNWPLIETFLLFLYETTFKVLFIPVYCGAVEISFYK